MKLNGCEKKNWTKQEEKLYSKSLIDFIKAFRFYKIMKEKKEENVKKDFGYYSERTKFSWSPLFVHLLADHEITIKNYI